MTCEVESRCVTPLYPHAPPIPPTPGMYSTYLYLLSFPSGFQNCERFKVGDNKKCDSADCTHIANAECEAGTSTCRCKSGFNYQGEGCVAGKYSGA